MSASVVEAETRPGDQILDGSRYQHLARPGERRDARGDVDGDALHVVAGDLDLAGVQTTADLNVQGPDRLGNGRNARHAPGRRRWRETRPQAISLRCRGRARVPA